MTDEVLPSGLCALVDDYFWNFGPFEKVER